MQDYYKASSGNSLQTFRDNLSDPSSLMTELKAPSVYSQWLQISYSNYFPHLLLTSTEFSLKNSLIEFHSAYFR